jgi:FkbM family methyltransferase
MISYAQNGEDVLLNRLFPSGYRGFYVDAGANDPVWNSVTKHFSLQGWRGVNIEPEAMMFERLVADRPGDINLNVGLSDREATLTFYLCHDTEHTRGWSTFSRAQADWMSARGMSFVKRTVPVTTLALVLEAHADCTVDFLKIDVESHEREVILGNDWTRWRPRVVLVEACTPEMWEPILLGADYLFAAFDGINRYYVRGEDRELVPLLAAPLSVLDVYVPYLYHWQIEELRAKLATYGEIGPVTLKFARSLRAAADRFPWLARRLKRLVAGVL